MSTKLLLGLTVILSSLAGSGLFAQKAEVGQPAPDFELTDSSGQTRRLSDYRGKLVVLEWVNHECPFVRKHYGSGNMQELQKTHTSDGVVWLSINTGSAGEQGVYPPAQVNRILREKGAGATAYLFDPDAEVARMYGARTTPHMYIVDREGILRYNGAIDSIRSTHRADIPRATNYVSAALGELRSGKPVSTPTAAPYGCAVKY